MSKKIVIGLSGAFGSTFLEWSIFYLSNQNQYFHQHLGLCQLTTNPLSGLNHTPQSNITTGNPIDLVNAHNHKNNVCYGFDQMKGFLSNTAPVGSLPSIIWHQSFAAVGDICKKAKISPEQLKIPEVLSEVKKLTHTDFAESINYCLDQNFKVIYVAFDARMPFYFVNKRYPASMATLMFENRSAQSIQEMENEFERIFYPEDNRHMWPNNCSSLWDQRERLALDRRPYDTVEWVTRHQPTFDRSKKHFYLNFLTYWTQFDQKVKDLMNYLELPIDNDRFQSWIKIYNDWQKIQTKFLDFSMRVDDIMDAIVHGWDYDLGILTFEEEVIIQHLLIYKHNLNLNSYKLTRFPKNAKTLHKLLKPLNHKVQLIY
jgi:hypothetical protein